MGRTQDRKRDRTLQERTGGKLRERAQAGSEAGQKSGGVSLKPLSQTSLYVPGVSHSSPRPKDGGEEDPAPWRERAGSAGSPVNGKQLPLPTPAQPQAEAQPGRTPGRLPAAWGLALARLRRRAREDREWRLVGRDRGGKEDGDKGEGKGEGNDGAKGQGDTDGGWGRGREAGTGSKMGTGQRRGDRDAGSAESLGIDNGVGGSGCRDLRGRARGLKAGWGGVEWGPRSNPEPDSNPDPARVLLASRNPAAAVPASRRPCVLRAAARSPGPRQ